MITRHGPRRRVNSALQNFGCLGIVSKVAKYDEASTLPNPMRCFDQPVVDRVPTGVTFSDPNSGVGVVLLVNGGSAAIGNVALHTI